MWLCTTVSTTLPWIGFTLFISQLKHMWRIGGCSRCEIPIYQSPPFPSTPALVQASLLFFKGDPKHLEILWSMMQKVLGVLLIAAVSTKVNSSADSHGTQNSNVDSHGSQNSSHNVQSRGSRADNGCWQIKYYYRLDSFHVEFFIFNELWNVTDMTDISV